MKTGGGACRMACAALILAASSAFAAPLQQAAATRLIAACRTRLEAEDAAGAAAAARQAVAADPASDDARLCLGIALTTLGQHAAAVDPLERVLKARPGDPDATFALANTYAALDDPRGETLFAQLAAAHPGDADVHVALAEYLWDHDQNQRANDEIERVLGTVHDRPDIRVTYATDLLRQWQFARAAEQLRLAQREGARTYQVAYLLGNALWEAGEIEAAAASFSNAIAIDAAPAPAQHELGRLLLWMGRAEEAVPHLEKAAAADPSAATALDLGRGYEKAGRLPEAEQAYRRALALEPSLSPIYYALGRLLARMQRQQDAAAALARYQQLYEAEQQQHFHELSHRAELDSASQDLRHGDAATALNKFQALGNTPDALVGTAKALSRLGRHADAIRALERVRVLAPKDQRVEYLLARERAAAARTR